MPGIAGRPWRHGGGTRESESESRSARRRPDTRQIAVGTTRPIRAVRHDGPPLMSLRTPPRHLPAARGRHARRVPPVSLGGELWIGEQEVALGCGHDTGARWTAVTMTAADHCVPLVPACSTSPPDPLRAAGGDVSWAELAVELVVPLSGHGGRHRGEVGLAHPGLGTCAVGASGTTSSSATVDGCSPGVVPLTPPPRPES